MTGRVRFNIPQMSTPQGVLPPVSLGAVTTPLSTNLQAPLNADVQWKQQEDKILAGQIEGPFIPSCAKLREKRTGEIFKYDERLAYFPHLFEPYDGELDVGCTADEAALVDEIEKLNRLLANTRQVKQGKATSIPMAPPIPTDLPMMAIGE